RTAAEAATRVPRVEVAGFQYVMVRGGHQFGVLPRLPGPQHEHHPAVLGVQGADRRVGDMLPTLAGVRGRGSAAHGEYGVEQQYPLRRPTGEVAVPGRLDAEVVAQFLEHVTQRGRHRDALPDAEAQPVRLAGLVVWILAENEYPGGVR